MENIDHNVRLAIQQDDVTANQHMRLVGRRRRQSTFQIWRARLDALLQARRKRAAADELLLETWGQAVFLGKSRRQVILVSAVPVANIAIVTLVVAALLIVISMFGVTIRVPFAISIPVPAAMTVPVPLGECIATGEREQRYPTGRQASPGFHGFLRLNRVAGNSA
jgi:hypothetical protein